MQPYFILLFLQEIPSVTPVTHYLQFFLTGSTGLQQLPEYFSVGILDGVQINYYDSNTRRAVPKQNWMSQNEETKYWEEQTQKAMFDEQLFNGNIEIVKRRLNHSEGIHTYLRTYGCEWDDETDEVNGFEHFGFDGEDFLSFDLETESWIAPVPQAVFTKQKWDNNKAWMTQEKFFLTQTCPEWLKKFVKLGETSLSRKDLPLVSLVQKTSSSPITCHATGFYPNRADLFWQKDEEELHEEEVKGEILPNHDGSFQMSVDLDLSGVEYEDWRMYSCVFQLAGVKEDIITKLDKDVILSNQNKRRSHHGVLPPVAVTVGFVVILLVIRHVLINRNNQAPESPSSSGQHASIQTRSSEEHNMLPSTA
ncbi:unnamed protein product [Ophioblennius macclurei]